jgi:hypothetical protein
MKLGHLVIGGVIFFLLLAAVVQLDYIKQLTSEGWASKIAALQQEYRTVEINRISFCSVRDFPGRTALGFYSGEGQVAVSRDLREYVGWWAYIPTLSDQPFFVTDLTHERFNNTVDVYTYYPADTAAAIGVRSGTVTFISPEGIKLLGNL